MDTGKKLQDPPTTRPIFYDLIVIQSLSWIPLSVLYFISTYSFWIPRLPSEIPEIPAICTWNTGYTCSAWNTGNTCGTWNTWNICSTWNNGSTCSTWNTGSTCSTWNTGNTCSTWKTWRVSCTWSTWSRVSWRCSYSWTGRSLLCWSLVSRKWKNSATWAKTTQKTWDKILKIYPRLNYRKETSYKIVINS